MYDLHSIANLILYLGLPGIIIFTILLGLRSKWFLNNQGKALLAVSASISVISLQIAATLIFGNDYFGRDITRLIVYSFFTVSSWWLAGSIIKAQAKDRKEDADLMDELRKAREIENKNNETPEETIVSVKIVKESWLKKFFSHKK